ncbi:hypothetical protein GQ43DRAFT_433273 [Delitschia confertaspora ATCC 74209]|uniref:Uncharacterized protein n=1 Tax=Delitschia confertaspora ATCC 74209 TaxID=1513339 RepID=A0A9P4JHN1_9PLEO|nr:hypothetical protein GQ43DRAFT_433273 [Delitschia confertaspora ATCC 74209]
MLLAHQGLDLLRSPIKEAVESLQEVCDDRSSLLHALVYSDLRYLAVSHPDPSPVLLEGIAMCEAADKFKGGIPRHTCSVRYKARVLNGDAAAAPGQDNNVSRMLSDSRVLLRSLGGCLSYVDRIYQNGRTEVLGQEKFAAVVGCGDTEIGIGGGECFR